MPKKIIITEYQIEKLNTVKNTEMRESLIYVLRRLYSFSRTNSYCDTENIFDEQVCVEFRHFRDYCISYNNVAIKRCTCSELLLDLDNKKIQTRIAKLEKLNIIKLIRQEKVGIHKNRDISIFKIIKY